MTIIEEELLTIRSRSDKMFQQIKHDVLLGIKKEKREILIDDAKKKISKSGVTYKEFRDLVSTVGLVPLKRHPNRV